MWGHWTSRPDLGLGLYSFDRGGAAASSLVGQPKKFFEARRDEKNFLGPPKKIEKF